MADSKTPRYTYHRWRGKWCVHDLQGVKIREFYHQEDARKLVYQLNGWKSDMSTKEQLISDVRLMRRYQKDYFRTRSQESLRYAKSMEKRVDAALEQIDRERSDSVCPKLF